MNKTWSFNFLNSSNYFPEFFAFFARSNPEGNLSGASLPGGTQTLIFFEDYFFSSSPEQVCPELSGANRRIGKELKNYWKIIGKE